MSDETDRLATLISDLRVGHRSEEIADAILTSDWLAERDARIRRQALDEAVEAIQAIDYIAELEHGDNGDWMRDEALSAVANLRDGGRDEW